MKTTTNAPSLEKPLLTTKRSQVRAAKLWRKNLTLEQHYALHRYAGPSYAALNAGLRSVDDPRFEEFGELDKKGINLHTVLRSIPEFVTDESLTVWRGSMMPDSPLVNGRWTDPAWVSCSVEEDYARFAASSSPENQRGELMEITLAPGCRYIPISYAIGDKQAGEILLLPCHRFKFTISDETGDSTPSHRTRAAKVACWKPWEFE